MNKKIAVYICGQYRTFDICHKLFFENVVNQNKDFDFEFFCRIKNDGRINITTIQSLVNDVRFKNISIVGPDIVPLKLPSFKNPIKISSIDNVYSNLKGQYDVIHYINLYTNINEYYGIIYLRCDYAIYQPLKLNIFNFKNTINSPSGRDYGGLNDQFYFGGVDVMQKVGTRVSEWLDLDEIQTPHPETYLMSFINKYKFNINRFNLKSCILR